MISAISNKGKVRFQIYDGRMNTDQLISFLKRLIKDAKRKMILILDNLRVHHAKLVKGWLLKHAEKIEVFYLPAYSPELNPDEYLNCDLKAGIHSKAPARKNNSKKKCFLTCECCKRACEGNEIFSSSKNLLSGIAKPTLYGCRVNKIEQ